MSASTNWTTIAASNYPWERDAIKFVRQHLPSHEPYRARANFELTADDGSRNKVDLLVLSPAGWFLVEIKSNPGVLSGDADTWQWKDGERVKTVDNPLRLAEAKAKKLKLLLQRQRAAKKLRLPVLDALVFCAAENLSCRAWPRVDRAAARLDLRRCYRRPEVFDMPAARSGDG